MKNSALNRRSMLALGAGAVSWGPAWATVFMDTEQVLQLLMPLADRCVPLNISLNAELLTQLAQLTGQRVPKNFAPKAWKAFRQGQSLGWVLTDRVIGKYDLIDFAAAFDPRGVQLGLEIMAYRESHGGEVRQSAWRQQFKGKRGPQSMRFGDDIRNISGATLSCQHVTEGVQRLSALVGTFA
jgi:Na+-translocating ferredoxin:NAD+ oxidoreductase RnfG subunit